MKWNPFIMDTTWTEDVVLYSEVSFAQGVIVDHAYLPVMLEHTCGP